MDNRKKLIAYRNSLEAFLKRWGVWILIVFALVYYGQYYRASLYPAAEGGVEGMVALRLMSGLRPIADTFLGYNLLWFYPVVGIFKIFGPSYTALRIFFLILCTLTGLMSYRVMRLCTGNATGAFLGGLLALLIPGQMFRNYLAFIVVLNMMVFLSAFVLPARTERVRLLWMATSGITLGIAWLIRIDVGFFLSCVWGGLLFLFPTGSRDFSDGIRRCWLSLLGAFLATGGFILLHVPFVLDAEQRGFAPEFLAQYEQWPAMIRFQGKQLTKSLSSSAFSLLDKTHAHPKIPASGAPARDSLSVSSVTTNTASQEKKEEPSTLARRSVTTGVARDRMMALNLYLPILLAGLLAAGAIGGWVMAWCLRDKILWRDSLILLTALGCSLALFPQYFFWRPDMVHLSEFMVPMTLTILLACYATLTFWQSPRKISRVFLGIFLFLAGLTLVLYDINACQSQSSGGIAVSQHKNCNFHAANGVDVKLSPSELKEASAVYRIITAVSAPGEYLICYPYNPEINFMTDRPSYEYNFYIDNAMIPSERFREETLKKIATYHPVVFVITNWAINNTEQSQFKNWAASTYATIAGSYILAYQHGNVELFVRPDRAAAIPAL